MADGAADIEREREEGQTRAPVSSVLFKEWLASALYCGANNVPGPPGGGGRRWDAGVVWFPGVPPS